MTLHMRLVPTLVLALSASLSACAGGEKGGEERPFSPPPASTPVAETRAAAVKPASPKPPDPLRARADLPPDRRAVLRVGDELRTVDARAAVAAGYSLVDLHDEWTPYILNKFKDADGKSLENRYRRIYIGLANDETDGDGQPLPEGRVNYLELFGVPPTLGVIRERFLADESRECMKTIDLELMGQMERIPYRRPPLQKKFERGMRRLAARVERARKKAKVETREELAEKDPRWADEVNALEQHELGKRISLEVEKRLRCEGHLRRTRARHKQGRYDHGMRKAVESFQHEHMIYEKPYLRPDTLKAMSTPALELDYASFVRAFRERVVHAASVLEDGSVTVGGTTPAYVNSKGEKVPVRNLVKELTEAALTGMGWKTPQDVLAFYKQFDREAFHWMRIAVKLPEKPEYYADHMDLSIEVDRGDVWYDPAWNAKGDLRYPRRRRMPKLRLFLNWRGQKIPLVRWPTTIGGWRAEQAANGYEYYRYKKSDVGPRVIRKVVSGPVWVAPPSTPTRGLVKGADVNGHRERIVNYDEMGPGYLSAYGLVAGYFVIPRDDGRDIDHGIRAHGSSDYMSIRGWARYSHGCHRLLNHLAVRLYSFILQHRNMVVRGDQRMRLDRQFLREASVYQVRMPSRGFLFELTPPLPVLVRPGRIMGKHRHPMRGYFEKPDLKYPPGPAPSPKGGVNTRAGDGGGDADDGETG